MVIKQTKNPYQALHIFHVESILWQWNELPQKGKAPGKSISDNKIQKFCINISKSFKISTLSIPKSTKTVARTLSCFTWTSRKEAWRQQRETGEHTAAWAACDFQATVFAGEQRKPGPKKNPVQLPAVSCKELLSLGHAILVTTRLLMISFCFSSETFWSPVTGTWTGASG